MNTKKAIVVGAGIVGLATARALALKGYKVTVMERNLRAVGASIRNFGMVWPVGQPEGESYNWAVRSRDIWKEIATKGNIWHEQVGSLHVGYSEQEMAVLEEYVAKYGKDRDCALLTAEQTLTRSEAIQGNGLKGALWSAEEVIVDPRDAIAGVARYLQEQLSVAFNWGTAVHRIDNNVVYYGHQQQEQADVIVVCSGADFESLFPDIYTSIAITKCKLQMLRIEAQPENWRIGPALCAGLSLLHYGAFRATKAVAELQKWAEWEMKDYLNYGIHVMVSQQGTGELTIGDSHEYGWCPDPFDREYINTLILDYLKQFTTFKADRISQTWNGVYAKMTNGDNHLFQQVNDHVFVLNALSGAGMTLSFGLAEATFADRV